MTDSINSQTLRCNMHGSGASETYLFALYETSYVPMSFQYLEGSVRDHVYLWGIQYIARKIQYMCLFNAPDGSWISIGYSISSWAGFNMYICCPNHY